MTPNTYPSTGEAIGYGILFLACFGLMGFCLYVAEDYSDSKRTFTEDCTAQGGHAVTPEPGRGERLCIDPTYLKEVKQ